MVTIAAEIQVDIQTFFSFLTVIIMNLVVLDVITEVLQTNFRFVYLCFIIVWLNSKHLIGQSLFTANRLNWQCRYELEEVFRKLLNHQKKGSVIQIPDGYVTENATNQPTHRHCLCLEMRVKLERHSVENLLHKL